MGAFSQTEKLLNIRGAENKRAYEVIIGVDLLGRCGDLAVGMLPETARRIAIISNPKVAGIYLEQTMKSLERVGFRTYSWLMKDGEQHKNMRSLKAALEFMSSSGIGRTDAVFALGGGVVGDLAGFAASIYNRGIPFIQAPTTLLSMIDSSVGGKTGVNSSFGKNLIGSFHQPSGVIADINTLQTLEKREVAAGYCEAVKHGALSGPNLLSKTARRMYRAGSPEMIDLIHSQIAFKARIVRQDPFEDPARTDARSRKILNFGHTLAHALEKATDYRYFRHGEAVGYGIMLAAELSKILEILDPDTVKSLNDVVHRVGSLPSLHKIDRQKVFDAFQHGKKVIGGSLQWVLIAGLGKPVIMSGSDVPRSAVKKALKTVFEQN